MGLHWGDLMNLTFIGNEKYVTQLSTGSVETIKIGTVTHIVPDRLVSQYCIQNFLTGYNIRKFNVKTLLKKSLMSNKY